MFNSDFSQRLLQGYGGTNSHVREVVHILTPHLMSNKIHGDSNLAAPSLYHLGPSAIPYFA